MVTSGGSIAVLELPVDTELQYTGSVFENISFFV